MRGPVLPGAPGWPTLPAGPEPVRGGDRGAARCTRPSDYEPSGIDIPRSVEERLREFAEGVLATTLATALGAPQSGSFLPELGMGPTRPIALHDAPTKLAVYPPLPSAERRAPSAERRAVRRRAIRPSEAGIASTSSASYPLVRQSLTSRCPLGLQRRICVASRRERAIRGADTSANSWLRPVNEAALRAPHRGGASSFASRVSPLEKASVTRRRFRVAAVAAASWSRVDAARRCQQGWLMYRLTNGMVALHELTDRGPVRIDN